MLGNPRLDVLEEPDEGQSSVSQSQFHGTLTGVMPKRNQWSVTFFIADL